MDILLAFDELCSSKSRLAWFRCNMIGKVLARLYIMLSITASYEITQLKAFDLSIAFDIVKHSSYLTDILISIGQ